MCVSPWVSNGAQFSWGTALALYARTEQYEYAGETAMLETSLEVDTVLGSRLFDVPSYLQSNTNLCKFIVPVVCACVSPATF